MKQPSGARRLHAPEAVPRAQRWQGASRMGREDKPPSGLRGGLCGRVGRGERSASPWEGTRGMAAASPQRAKRSPARAAAAAAKEKSGGKRATLGASGCERRIPTHVGRHCREDAGRQRRWRSGCEASAVRGLVGGFAGWMIGEISSLARLVHCRD